MCVVFFQQLNRYICCHIFRWVIHNVGLCKSWKARVFLFAHWKEKKLVLNNLHLREKLWLPVRYHQKKICDLLIYWNLKQVFPLLDFTHWHFHRVPKSFHNIRTVDGERPNYVVLCWEIFIFNKKIRTLVPRTSKLWRVTLGKTFRVNQSVWMIMWLNPLTKRNKT